MSVSVKPGKRVSTLWLAAVLIAVAVLYRILSVNIAAQKDLYIQQERASRITLSRYESEHAALVREIELSGTDAYIENLARTKYGFLKPGEIRFEIINPEVLFSYGDEPAFVQVIGGG